MKTQVKHTAGNWEVINLTKRQGYDTAYIPITMGNNNNSVRVYGEDKEANAKIIVQAVNSYDAMREALEYANKTLRECVSVGVSLKDNSIGLAITTIEQALKDSEVQ